MSTFDRYILRRFWHVFVVSFIAMMGLYIVIDAFNNVDNFFAHNEGGPLSIMWNMIRFYGYRSCLFFDTIGSIVSITAVSVVLSLLLRHGELNPVLASGIPTYRLLSPLLFGTVMVIGIMIFNKEVIIPRIADKLQIEAGKTGEEAETIESVRDYATMIEFSGDKMVLGRNAILHPDFVLPTPEFVDEITSITGTEAVFYPANPETRRPSGWLVKQAQPAYHELHLTVKGRQTVLRGKNEGEIFVATDIGCDHLFEPNKTVDLLSTPELVRRIKSPAYDPLAVRSHTLHLHRRLTQPILNIVLLFLVLPLIIRREATSLVVSMALSGFMQGVVFGSSQAALWLAGKNIIGPDLAAWGPVITAGALAAWFWSILRT